jgi:hypothetical protein
MATFFDDIKASYESVGKKPKDEAYYFKRRGSAADTPKSTYGTPAWYDLKAKAQIWGRDVVKLYNTKVPTRLEGKKRDLITRAKFIKTALEKIFGSIQGVSDMNLGIAPIVVAAGAVSGAAVLISKWYYDNAALERDMSSGVYNDLIKKGFDPTKAAAISAKVAGQTASVLERAKQLAPWLVGGVVLYIFRDKLKSIISR